MAQTTSKSQDKMNSTTNSNDKSKGCFSLADKDGVSLSSTTHKSKPDWQSDMRTLLLSLTHSEMARISMLLPVNELDVLAKLLSTHCILCFTVEEQIHLLPLLNVLSSRPQGESLATLCQTLKILSTASTSWRQDSSLSSERLVILSVREDTSACGMGDVAITNDGTIRVSRSKLTMG